MERKKLQALLRKVKEGKVSLKEAMNELKTLPFEDLGFAKLDSHRALRKGFPEVVYCPGKTRTQLMSIFQRLSEKNKTVLATKAEKEVFLAAKSSLLERKISYYDQAKLILIGEPVKRKKGRILVITAGTSDIPIAEEAAVTCEILGKNTKRLYDVGVAGVHRLLSHKVLLDWAQVIIVVAGMEAALPSVVSGIVDKPVIAVPTSVGYGASFDGLAALLAMMNTCSPGSVVVNIDNGFGAGYFASLISG